MHVSRSNTHAAAIYSKDMTKASVALPWLPW